MPGAESIQSLRSVSASGAEPLRLRLLTLNVHKGFTAFNRRFVLHELRDAVHAVGADVVFLQEVIGSHSGHARLHPTWPDEPQYQFLASSLWGSYAYGRNAVYTEGHHGNALLSKFPIAHWFNHDISVGREEPRGLLHCVLSIAHLPHPLHVVCVHLALTRDHRRQQLARLCHLVDSEVPAASPLFIAGDFNDWSNQAQRALASCARLEEAFERLRGAPARTFPAHFPLLRLDRVYVRNAVPRRAEVLSRRPWSKLSDHAALSVEVEVERR